MNIIRKITSAAAILLCCTAINAQDEVNPNDVWKKNNYFNLGYANAETGTNFSAVQKSKFSFYLAKGNVYYWPKSKPWFGMLKVGLDVRWVDISMAKYKTDTDGTGNGWGESNDWNTDTDGTVDEWTDKLNNLGCYNLTMGAFGIGPNIGISPFAKMSNGLRHLRASIYFHYQPAVTAYFVSQDGETEFSWAYTGMMDFGGKITYRAISIGIEGRWGKGSFKPLDFSGMFGDEDDSGSESIKIDRKFAATRFYIGFTF